MYCFSACCGAFPSPKGSPEGPKRAPEGLQEGPRGAPQAPRGPPETPRAGQEGSKPAQELPRASQDAHKAFPKHLARQPFSENAKIFKAWLQKASKTLKIAHIDESQRPCHNSQEENMRADGGDPPWGSQSAARPGGAKPGVSDK